MIRQAPCKHMFRTKVFFLNIFSLHWLVELRAMEPADHMAAVSMRKSFRDYPALRSALLLHNWESLKVASSNHSRHSEL